MPRHFNAKNPFPLDLQELANFVERRVSVYQVGVTGEVNARARSDSEAGPRAG